MADKTINELTAASTMTDDDLLVLQQNGVAKKLSGKSLGSYVSSAAEAKVNELNTAIDNKISEVQQAINDAETDINSIVTAVQNMTELGTDTTLTTSGMAADAKATGNAVSDLKESITQYAGNSEVKLLDGYITSNTSPVNIDSVTASENYKHCVVNCSEGDTFTLTGTGGRSPKLWCFIDNENNIVSVAGNDRSEESTVLTAPQNATKIIFNTNCTTNPNSKFIINELVGLTMDKYNDRLNALNAEINGLFNNQINISNLSGDYFNLLDGLKITKYNNFVFINGINDSNSFRIGLTAIPEGYTANPTYSAKPKWYIDMPQFIVGHRYSIALHLLSGSYVYEDPTKSDPFLTLRNQDQSLNVSFARNRNYTLPKALNTIYMTIQAGTYNNCCFYIEVTDLTAQETNSDINLIPTKYKPIFDHLFINDTGNNITIPAESLFHVRVSSKFGFDVIEVHPQKTSDNHYICNHLDNGAFGSYFHHVDNTTDISATKVNSVTLEWIQENVRYNTSIAKFQTAPPTLEEFLKECRQQCITPMISTQEDADIISIADAIMGEHNYIAYGASRTLCPKATIMHWKSDLTDKNDILNYCISVGKPFIYGLSNISSFNDIALSELAALLHKNGFWLLASYADNGTWANIYKGIDFYSANRSINRIENGNICNFSTIANYDKFTLTNATITDGVAIFTTQGTIAPNIDNTIYDLAMIDIELWFNGTITLSAIGEQFSSLSKTSTGDVPIIFTVPIINGSPKFTITANANTVVKNIYFKAS